MRDTYEFLQVIYTKLQRPQLTTCLVITGLGIQI